MVDLARTQFPEDMVHPSRSEGLPWESLSEELIERVKNYARDEPIAFACWAFGIGFLVGWRLKPW